MDAIDGRRERESEKDKINMELFVCGWFEGVCGCNNLTFFKLVVLSVIDQI